MLSDSENVTELPPTVALTWTGPGVFPSVAVVVAILFVSVLLVVGLTVAEPDTTCHVTVWDALGVLPLVTFTLSATVCPGRPEVLSPPLI